MIWHLGIYFLRRITRPQFTLFSNYLQVAIEKLPQRNNKIKMPRHFPFDSYKYTLDNPLCVWVLNDLESSNIYILRRISRRLFYICELWK